MSKHIITKTATLRRAIYCPICGTVLQPPTRHSCGSSKETEVRAPITGAQPDILDEESDQAYAEALSDRDDLTEEEQDAPRTSTPSYNHERKTSNMPATTATKTAARKHIRILKSPRLEAEATECSLDDMAAQCGGDYEEAETLVQLEELWVKAPPKTRDFVLWTLDCFAEMKSGSALPSIAHAALRRALKAKKGAERESAIYQLYEIHEAELAAGQQGR